MSESQGLHASPSEWPRALFYVALLFSIYQIVTAAFHPVSPAPVELTAAAEFAIANMESNFKKIRELRDYFIAGLKKCVPDVSINSVSDPALPGIVNATFPGTEI